MIDLTPLDVRNKRGDFKKAMRGYEPHEVDLFLEMAADRLETLVRENLQLRERTQTLQTQVAAQNDREQAVQDALVTAQELRADIRAQSQREADHVIREAQVESRRMLAEAEEVVRDRLRGIERQLDQASRSVEELERRRARFLTEFRGLLERELDVVQVEESRVPLEARAIDLDLGPAPSERGEAATPESPESAALRFVPDVTPDAVPPEIPSPEAVSEESADAIIPAGVDPFLSSDLTTPPDDLVPLGGVSGSIAAGVAGLGFAATPEPDEIPEAPSSPEVSSTVEGDADASGSIQADLSVAMDVDALRPDVGAGMPEPEVFNSEAEEYHEQRYGPTPDPTVLPVDVADLGPTPADAVETPHLPPLPGAGTPPPSALEVELMAGASGDGLRPTEDHDRFAGIPDLETVLAEAGVDEPPPPPSEETAPPPVRPDDPILLFDPDDDDPYR